MPEAVWGRVGRSFLLGPPQKRRTNLVNSLRFALLGHDSLFEPLLAEIAAGGHRLVRIESNLGDPAPRGGSELARAGVSWEELPHGDLADVVLVGRGPADLREDQLRRLAQAGVATVVAHPGSLAPLFCYELDMICRENGCVLLPYYPGESHPALAVLRLALGFAEATSFQGQEISMLGAIDQITFERRLEVRDKLAVGDQLARDIDLLISVAGAQTKVLALASGEGERAFTSLSVQLTGPNKIVSRWSVLPADGQTSARLVVTGSRGRITLEMPADIDDWRVEQEWFEKQGASHQNEARQVDLSETRSPTLLNRLFAALEQQREAAKTQPASAARISGAQRNERWFQACQSIDLLEAVERSILKGRAIELHFEDYTSEATFKGRMSAIGCAVLMLGLATCMIGFVADLIHGIYQRMVGQNVEPATRWWPWALLFCLAVFLLIQVLPKLFPEPEKKGDSGKREVRD